MRLSFKEVGWLASTLDTLLILGSFHFNQHSHVCVCIYIYQVAQEEGKIFSFGVHIYNNFFLRNWQFCYSPYIRKSLSGTAFYG